MVTAKKCTKGALVDPSGKNNTFTYNPGQAATATNSHTYNRIGTPSLNVAPDGYNNMGFGNLLVPLTQKSVIGSLSYQVAERVKFKVHSQYMEASTVSDTVPLELSLGNGGTPQGVGIQIANNSYYNPFGVAVGSVRRAMTEAGIRQKFSTAKTFAVSPTLTGDFNLAGRSFDWEAGTVYARTRQKSDNSNEISVSRLKNALGPSFKDASGNIVCGTPGNVIAGCVPMNLLGSGTITPEMLNYVRLAQDSFGFENHADTHDYFATISSPDLLPLPAGSVGFAGGFERNVWDGASPTFGAYTTNDVLSGQRSGTVGHYAANDLFAEFYVPLLKDLPLIKKLDLSIAGRHSAFNNDQTSVNKKFGLKWQVNSDLALRGSYSTGYRVDVSGLVLQLQDTSVSIAPTDPCSYTTNVAGAKVSDRYGALSADMKARCTQAGVPAGGYDSRTAPTTTQHQQPNLDIGPETDIFRTVGLVYSPSYVKGLDLTLDYWNVTFSGSLYRPFGSTQPALVQACLTNPGDPHLCPSGWVVRNAGGAVTDVRSSQLNAPGGERYEGVDFNLNYRTKVALGTLNLNWSNAFFLDAKDPTKPLPTYVGIYQNNRPIYRLRSNLNLDFSRANWGVRETLRYFSSLREDCGSGANNFAGTVFAQDACNALGPAQSFNANGTANYLPFSQGGSANNIPRYVLVDVSGYYKLTPNSQVKIGVNNLLNREAPKSIISGRNYVASFGIPSRYGYVEFIQRF